MPRDALVRPMRTLGLSLSFALALCLTAPAAQFPRPAAQMLGPETAGFQRDVERTSRGFAFACVSGCTWKTVAARCADRSKCSVTIDDHGIVDVQNPSRQTFSILVTATVDGYFLSCDRGCAWATLAFSCPRGGRCASTITQFGKSRD